MHTSSHGCFYIPPGSKRLRVRRVRSRSVAESVCGLDVNQSLSQPTKYIPLTVHKAPELTKLQAASNVGVRYTWPLELARETELRWKNHLFLSKLKACAGHLLIFFLLFLRHIESRYRAPVEPLLADSPPSLLKFTAQQISLLALHTSPSQVFEPRRLHSELRTSRCVFELHHRQDSKLPLLCCSSSSTAASCNFQIHSPGQELKRHGRQTSTTFTPLREGTKGGDREASSITLSNYC